MNKKALSPITAVFWFVGFLVVWIFFASEKLRYWGLQAVSLNNLTGIEAFLYSNVNLIVMFMVFIFMIVIMYVGGE